MGFERERPDGVGEECDFALGIQGVGGDGGMEGWALSLRVR